MAFIELSTITFTDQNDIVSVFEQDDTILNTGITNTLAGNDTITAIGNRTAILNFYNAVLDMGDGDDIITGTGSFIAIFNQGGIINAGNGNDIITGTTIQHPEPLPVPTHAINNQGGTIDTGNGNDIITGSGNETGDIGILNTLNSSVAVINTGEGNDTITGTSIDTWGIYNSDSIIDTGDGNDIITGGGVGIYNDSTINTGNGKDSIIADGGFEGSGNVFLGNGKDYLKGFGSGNFNGGNGKDTLELTSGSYTIGISGAVVSFTKNSIIMNTSEFEKLIAGGTTYDFSNLTDGQTIYVA